MAKKEPQKCQNIYDVLAQIIAYSLFNPRICLILCGWSASILIFFLLPASDRTQVALQLIALIDSRMNRTLPFLLLLFLVIIIVILSLVIWFLQRHYDYALHQKEEEIQRLTAMFSIKRGKK
jgi:hypothetical protein